MKDNGFESPGRMQGGEYVSASCLNAVSADRDQFDTAASREPRVRFDFPLLAFLTHLKLPRSHLFPSILCPSSKPRLVWSGDCHSNLFGGKMPHTSNVARVWAVGISLSGESTLECHAAIHDELTRTHRASLFESATGFLHHRGIY